MLSLALSTTFGLVMVAATGAGQHGPAFVAAALAVVAVLAGTLFRPASTLAVLISVVAVMLADTSPAYAALCGLCATAYLLVRHAGTNLTWPTLVAAVGFTLAGVVAACFPLQLPWVPLLAPLTVVALYLLTTRPFVGGRDEPS